MVPEAFKLFFSTSAAAGATLVGLLFVAVSIAPHESVKASAPIERQALSSSAFTALLNAFFISLGALIPFSNLGIITIFMGSVGLLNTLALGSHLMKQWAGWRVLLQRVILLLASIILYGYEIYFAILLLTTPNDSGPLYGMTGLLIGIYGLGIVRAWQILGAQRFTVLGDWFRLLQNPPERPAPGKEAPPDSLDDK